MNVFLVVLAGGGDLYVSVVDQETFDWITSDDLGKPKGEENASGWEDQLVPASQISKIKAHDGDYYEPVYITIGSYNNDRAIRARSADGYFEDFDTIKKALKAIKTKGDTLEDEYHGDMY